MPRSTRYLLIAVLLVSGSATAQMQRERAETWDVGLYVMNSGSLSLSGEENSGLNIDSEYGWGFWGNYNFTNRFALGFDFNWVRPDYDATFVPENDPTSPVTISHQLSIFSIQGKGTFHFVEGPISPYIEGGFGWTNVDSNVAEGPPTTGCWWDPWWGYICRPFFSTYSESLTSYSLAGGLRWDVNETYGLRASYGVLELDTSSRTENASFDMWRVDFSWRF